MRACKIVIFNVLVTAKNMVHTWVHSMEANNIYNLQVCLLLQTFLRFSLFDLSAQLHVWTFLRKKAKVLQFHIQVNVIDKTVQFHLVQAKILCGANFKVLTILVIIGNGKCVLQVGSGNGTVVRMRIYSGPIGTIIRNLKIPIALKKL